MRDVSAGSLDDGVAQGIGSVLEQETAQVVHLVEVGHPAVCCCVVLLDVFRDVIPTAGVRLRHLLQVCTHLYYNCY